MPQVPYSYSFSVARFARPDRCPEDFPKPFAGSPFAVPSFTDPLRPFLEQNCQPCHNSKVRSGDVNFELLKYAKSPAGQRRSWEVALYAMKQGQMPPEGAPKPPKEQMLAAISAIEAGLAKLDETKSESPPPRKDWLTWQGDPERTGWAKAETTLTKSNVSGLSLLWKSQLDALPSPVNGYSTLTDPLVAEGVPTKQGLKTIVFTASAENNVYAIDAETGAILWERRFPNASKPPLPPTGNCPNNLNATPVIDKTAGILYVLANDGKLRGLGLGDGDDRMAPTAFVAPYARNWSLNLVDGVIYTSTSRGSGKRSQRCRDGRAQSRPPCLPVLHKFG